MWKLLWLMPLACQNSGLRFSSLAWKVWNFENVQRLKTFPLFHRTKDCHVVYLDGPPAYNKTGPVFGAVWTGIKGQKYQEARPMTQSSAMDLLNAAVFSVKCRGKLCHYDPPNKPPGKLTCQDKPCPSDQECCQYDGSYTCCAVGQHCVSGYCQWSNAVGVE